MDACQQKTKRTTILLVLFADPDSRHGRQHYITVNLKLTQAE